MCMNKLKFTIVIIIFSLGITYLDMLVKEFAFTARKQRYEQLRTELYNAYQELFAESGKAKTDEERRIIQERSAANNEKRKEVVRLGWEVAPSPPPEEEFESKLNSDIGFTEIDIQHPGLMSSNIDIEKVKQQLVRLKELKKKFNNYKIEGKLSSGKSLKELQAEYEQIKNMPLVK